MVRCTSLPVFYVRIETHDNYRQLPETDGRKTPVSVERCHGSSIIREISTVVFSHLSVEKREVQSGILCHANRLPLEDHILSHAPLPIDHTPRCILG